MLIFLDTISNVIKLCKNIYLTQLHSCLLTKQLTAKLNCVSKIRRVEGKEFSAYYPFSVRFTLLYVLFFSITMNSLYIKLNIPVSYLYHEIITKDNKF